MDLTYSKVASRKRMNSDVGNLEEKVSRETANIIKKCPTALGSREPGVGSRESAEPEARVHHADASADAVYHRNLRDAFAAQLARRDAELELRERTVAELRDELTRSASDFSAQIDRSRSETLALVREAGALRVALNAALCTTLRVAEALGAEARGVEERDALAAVAERVGELQRQRQEACSTIDELKLELRSAVEKNEELVKDLADKNQRIRSLEELKDDRTHGVDAARHADELRAATAERDQRAITIQQLLHDVAAEAEGRARSDAALAAARADLHTARAEQVRLNMMMCTSDKKASEEMKVTLAEKERLVQEVLFMRGTIDKLQKELASRGAAHDPPDLDDNAVATPPRAAPDSLYGPRAPDSPMSIFNLFSDDSDAAVRFSTPARGALKSRGAAYPARPDTPTVGARADVQAAPGARRGFFKNRRATARQKKQI